MADPIFDRKDQLKQIEEGLLDGESIIAVYDAIGVSTGFLGLTTKRAIIMDKSFVGKKVALTSIPYSKISSVSVVSNRSFAGQYFSSGNIAIHVGTQVYEIEFRGDKKTHHAHQVIMHHISL
ncbi:PH (Pleckstrin Homology) domain-containing protein [Stackebrandtia endophytica]|uniref:PH (Pleckstrin Homology) domain-containing protein n=1 Tax=Stackebrandtia endophytica TaxID=1496996 RepID=A0A543AXG9_9ACTN|nr:PH domain-containing protein [Stackebrandtia endophytica]TQL77250.1 PH (Pleckstrin Homology) domain-containing protein [Stackebrandtia endophytica]